MEASKKPSDTKSVFSMWSLGGDFDPWSCCIPRLWRNKYKTYDFMNRKMSQSGSKTKTTLLTGQQRLIILKTWPKVSLDISALSICAMTKLLELDFGLKNLFDLGEKTPQEAQHDPQFRQHAFWLIQAVSAVVENLDTLDVTVADMFTEIGEKHALIPDFHISLFAILPEAWNFAWEDQLRERYTAQAERSWDMIFQYIVNSLAQGYEHITRSSASVVSIPASPSNVTVRTSFAEFTSSSSTADFESSDSDSETEMSVASNRTEKDEACIVRDLDNLSGLRITPDPSVKSSNETSPAKRGGRHAPRRKSKVSEKSSPRKLSEPTQNTNNGSSERSRKTSTMSERTPAKGPGSDNTALPPKTSVPPSEEPAMPAVLQGDKSIKNGKLLGIKK